jgi:hypothetical protein
MTTTTTAFRAESTMRTIKLGPMAVSDEALQDILDTAGYGIAYWCSSATNDPNAKTYSMLEREDEEEEHVVTYDKLHETFWRIVAGEFSMAGYVRKYFLDAVVDGFAEDSEDIDAGHIDGAAADVLVQCAAFGEIVFG